MSFCNRLRRVARPATSPSSARRWLSQCAYGQALKKPVQSYLSTTRDPRLNLSIEHHLLQNTPPESTVFFTYVNRPSIIIGRNQNPWLETNLALLKQSRDQLSDLGQVELVRRRSGGGTVFHDSGNVNWTVICPPANFTRDKHAEMVVRALRSRGVDRARVNERHDIVLDQGSRGHETDVKDTHLTPYTTAEPEKALRPLKVSGSAYKLTRNRALHHGTCLLSSLNLNIIPDYLHSPAKPFIKARGVESVSSPVGNIDMLNEDFQQAAQDEFAKLYDGGRDVAFNTVGDEMLDVESIRKGYNELKSLDFTYLQTPQFDLSNMSDPEAHATIELTFRHGVLHGGYISPKADVMAESGKFELTLDTLGSALHEIESWEEVLAPSLQLVSKKGREDILAWLNRVMPHLQA